MGAGYKTFYGEFSLRQWINMILKKDVVLPDYQRHFVWKDKDVKRLIDSLKQGIIVPPVIVAQHDGKNYLLDGQQRLSSILLAFLGIFPLSNNKDRTNAYSSDSHIHEDDDDTANTAYEKILHWKFSIIQEEYKHCKNDADTLKQRLRNDSSNYSTIDYAVLDDSFENNFIGFAFSRRMPHAAEEQHAHFAKTFHAINTSGTPLSGHEARRAYYWLKPHLSKLLEPYFSKQIFVEQSVGDKYVIDFVRPLAFAVDHFTTTGVNATNSPHVAKGYSGKVENYLTYFVQRCAGLDESNTYTFFGDIDSVIPQNTIESRISHIESICQLPDFLPKFTAAYEYDYYFFGLVYWIIVRGKKVEITDIQNFTRKMQRTIKIFKNDSNNTTKYNTLGRIRDRLRTSIQLYEAYSKRDI